MQICTAIGSQIVPTAASFARCASDSAKSTVASPAVPAARIVPGVGNHHRSARCGKSARNGFLFIDQRHDEGAALGEKLKAELACEYRTFFRLSVGKHDHLRAHFRNVTGHEAVNDGNRQDIRVGRFHLHNPVDEGAHRLARCRIANIDHAASRTPTSPA